MKMLVNIVNLGREGIQIIWLIKMKEWEKRGFAIHIQTGLFTKSISLKDRDVYRFNQEFPELAEIPEASYSKLGYIGHALRRNIRQFGNYQRVKKENYQVLYTLTSVLEFLLFPCFYRLLNPRSRWLTVFDNTVPLFGPGNPLIRVLAWVFFQISVLFLRQADIIFAITPDLRRYLLRRGFPKDKIVVTGCAVEKERIQAAQFDPAFESDALYMGRINEKKGIYDMLEILRMVIKKRPNFILAIMGGGDAPSVIAFRQKIRKFGLEKNVRFLGYRAGPEKFNIIKSSKIFWFFSYDESFGVALLEAVCSGKHALVYELPPYRYLYQQGEVIPFVRGQFRAIAEKTINLLESGDLDNEKGRRLAEKFSWEKIVAAEYAAFRTKESYETNRSEAV